MQTDDTFTHDVVWLAERWKLPPSEVLDHAAMSWLSAYVVAQGWPVEYGLCLNREPGTWKRFAGPRPMHGLAQLDRPQLLCLKENGECTLETVVAPAVLQAMHAGPVGKVCATPLPVVRVADVRVLDSEWMDFEARLGFEVEAEASPAEAAKPVEQAGLKAKFAKIVKLATIGQQRQRGKANQEITTGALVSLLAKRKPYRADDGRPIIEEIFRAVVGELPNGLDEKGFSKSIVRDRLTDGFKAFETLKAREATKAEGQR